VNPEPNEGFETKRLLFHRHVLEDFDECAAMWADPLVVRHISGKPSTREESWSRVMRYAGHWRLLGFGYWAVREKDTGRFVGDVGLSDFRREITPSLEGLPEAGWVLASWAQGRGFATEAVRAVLAFHELQFDTPRTVCMISPENTPSLRVAEKCGYKEFAHTLYKGDAVILFERVQARGAEA
jgi:RimJ/RimL family protein N-acetyltransferase